MDVSIDSMVWVNVGDIGDREAAAIKTALTQKDKDYMTGVITDVTSYLERDGYLGLPRSYGLWYLANKQPDASILDKRSEGVAPLFPLKAVKPRDYQVVPLEDAEHHLRSYSDCSFKAATGKGKTVCALELVRRLNVNALVIVDQDNLFDQWKNDNALNPDLFSLPEEAVGVVKGPKVEYLGKTVVIATIQSLTRKELPEDFYEHFGMIIYDEAHTTATAETYMSTLYKFTARYRLVVTATPRTDVNGEALKHHVGEVAVQITDKHHKSNVRYVESYGTYSQYANTCKMQTQMLAEITEDGERNRVIMDIIKWVHEKTERDTLIVSERVEHLSHIKTLMVAYGIPEDQIGVAAASFAKWKLRKDPTPGVKPAGYQRGSEYSPVHWVLETKAVKKVDREDAKNNKRYILSTFKAFEKGVDAPRLSCGIDLTPASKAAQLIGRILRTQENKLKPLWITIRDVNSIRCEAKFLKRLTDYRESNADLHQWVLGKGVRKCQIKELRADVNQSLKYLRQREVLINADGNYIVPTQPTVKKSKKYQGRPTARK
jgi:superfamily II DNA or RNA helicase